MTEMDLMSSTYRTFLCYSNCSIVLRITEVQQGNQRDCRADRIWLIHGTHVAPQQTMAENELLLPSKSNQSESFPAQTLNDR